MKATLADGIVVEGTPEEIDALLRLRAAPQPTPTTAPWAPPWTAPGTGIVPEPGPWTITARPAGCCCPTEEMVRQHGSAWWIACPVHSGVCVYTETWAPGASYSAGDTVVPRC